MSLDLWWKLPKGFLKIRYRRWCALDSEVRRLIVELAHAQKFHCALCSSNRDLIIEHDHEPQEGTGDSYTVYNIRGLVCRRCNWHLMIYEKQENGETINWENANSHLDSSEYGDYIYSYECRVEPLLEALLEKRMGSRNYWHRRLTLQKFDAWYYDGEQRPASLRRFLERESRKIRTPEDFFRALCAMMQFVIDQRSKDPNYEPPDDFWKIMHKVGPIIDEAVADLKNRRSLQPGHG